MQSPPTQNLQVQTGNLSTIPYTFTEVLKMTQTNKLDNQQLEATSIKQNEEKISTQKGNRFWQFFLKNFETGANQQPTLLGHLLLTSSLLMLIGIGYFSMQWSASKKANEWLGATQNFTPLSEGIKNASEDEKTRLKQQFEEIQARSHRYATIMTFFYQQYYVSISLTSASALVAGICLFFISKKGWDRVNNAVINVFIVASGSVIFFGDLPGIFRQNENSTTSRDLYIAHVSLRNKVLSYLATGATVGAEPEKPNEFSRPETSRFILYVDQKLAELNQVPIGFDPTGIGDVERKSRFGLPEKPQSGNKQQNHGV